MVEKLKFLRNVWTALLVSPKFSATKGNVPSLVLRTEKLLARPNFFVISHTKSDDEV